MVGELVKGRKQVGYLGILLLLAGLPQLLEGIHHHDELLESINAEGEILLGNVKTL